MVVAVTAAAAVCRKGEDYLAVPYTEPVDGRQEFVHDGVTTGDFLTYIGFDAVVLDRYDPHQTQFGPMYSNQSAMFSKLYRYASHEDPTWDNILPDLAESAPEMIGDPGAPTEYVVKLRKGVKFHNTERIRKDFPDLAGRELTADDVIYSYNARRTTTARSGPTTTARASTRRSTRSRRSTTTRSASRRTVRSRPSIHFMADTNAMIIPKEIVDIEPGPDGRPWDSVDSFGTASVAPPTG